MVLYFFKVVVALSCTMHDFGLKIVLKCIALLGHGRRMTRQINNMKNSSGDTALIWAVVHGHLSCVEEMAKLDGVDWET